MNIVFRGNLFYIGKCKKIKTYVLKYVVQLYLYRYESLRSLLKISGKYVYIHAYKDNLTEDNIILLNKINKIIPFILSIFYITDNYVDIINKLECDINIQSNTIKSYRFDDNKLRHHIEVTPFCLVGDILYKIVFDISDEHGYDIVECQCLEVSYTQNNKNGEFKFSGKLQFIDKNDIVRYIDFTDDEYTFKSYEPAEKKLKELREDYSKIMGRD